MPPPWLEIVYVVVSMAIVIGLFSLNGWGQIPRNRCKRPVCAYPPRPSAEPRNGR